MLVHGGLTIGPNARTKEEISAKTDGIYEATTLGGKMLLNGASATDACIAVVARLENAPLFNAGYGASLTSEGFPELDATIMDGAELRSGSVALIRRYQNPILIAASLLKGPTAAIAGESAEREAARLGLPMVKPTDLITARSRQIFEESRHSGAAEGGTVGAVAMDAEGNLAAAISSGGVPLKPPGRLADSCMPGVGVYASNRSAAVSCTGYGETIMRLTVARDVAAITEFSNLPLQASARKIALRIARLGGAAAFISIDRTGEYAVASGLPDLHWGLWKAGIGISAQSTLPLDSPSIDNKIYGVFSNNSIL